MHHRAVPGPDHAHHLLRGQDFDRLTLTHPGAFYLEGMYASTIYRWEMPGKFRPLSDL